MNKQKFPLINVVKYSKNHYKVSDNIWNDLALCLNADGYGPFYETNKWGGKNDIRKDIANIITCKVTSLLIEPDKMYDFIIKLSPENWKFYYNDKEYDYWYALVKACLQEMSNRTCEELGYENWDLFKKYNVKELKKRKRFC